MSQIIYSTYLHSKQQGKDYSCYICFKHAVEIAIKGLEIDTHILPKIEFYPCVLCNNESNKSGDLIIP